MKFIMVAALIGAAQMAQVTRLNNEQKLYLNIQVEDCPDKSEEQLAFELGQFSRTFDMKNWENAMEIYDTLKGAGKKPKIAVTTKELYDHSFSFPKVRNYDYAVQNMNDLEAAEDNLNKNIEN